CGGVRQLDDVPYGWAGRLHGTTLCAANGVSRRIGAGRRRSRKTLSARDIDIGQYVRRAIRIDDIAYVATSMMRRPGRSASSSRATPIGKKTIRFERTVFRRFFAQILLIPNSWDVYILANTA